RDARAAGETHRRRGTECAVGAAIEPSSLRVENVDAAAHVLPWVECEAAAASAGRVVGRSVAELRSHVRTDFKGPSTCTHLNDTLRSLDDVAALAAHPRESQRGWTHLPDSAWAQPGQHRERGQRGRARLGDGRARRAPP